MVEMLFAKAFKCSLEEGALERFDFRVIHRTTAQPGEQFGRSQSLEFLERQIRQVARRNGNRSWVNCQ